MTTYSWGPEQVNLDCIIILLTKAMDDIHKAANRKQQCKTKKPTELAMLVLKTQQEIYC